MCLLQCLMLKEEPGDSSGVFAAKYDGKGKTGDSSGVFAAEFDVERRARRIQRCFCCKV